MICSIVLIDWNRTETVSLYDHNNDSDTFLPYCLLKEKKKEKNFKHFDKSLAWDLSFSFYLILFLTFYAPRDGLCGRSRRIIKRVSNKMSSFLNKNCLPIRYLKEEKNIEKKCEQIPLEIGKIFKSRFQICKTWREWKTKSCSIKKSNKD